MESLSENTGSASMFNDDFQVGITADEELTTNLNKIIENAANYSAAIDILNNYFTTDNLWVGDDAKALQESVTASDGPLAKLKKYEEELAKLSKLAASLRDALGKAQTGLKNNVNKAMKAGE